VTGDSLNPEQPPSGPLCAPESASGPRVGTERRSGGGSGPQAGAEGFEDLRQRLDALAAPALAVRDAELQQLRAQVALVAGYADAWYQSGTGSTRECGRTILAALRPQGECRRCHCPAGTPQCEHCNCCDVPDPRDPS